VKNLLGSGEKAKKIIKKAQNNRGNQEIQGKNPK
jgi:hypothetical protein